MSICQVSNICPKNFVFQEILPLFWVNMTSFDYKGVLRVGPQTVCMWEYTKEAQYTLQDDEILNPIGRFCLPPFFSPADPAPYKILWVQPPYFAPYRA